MEIRVRNMVCDRCIKAVTEIFKHHAIPVTSVRLGVVETKDQPGEKQTNQLKHALLQEGFEWLDNQKVKLTEDIKGVMRQLVQQGELDEMKINLSLYLSTQLHKDYHYLSAIFSSVENYTIEQYFILQKIEKVKEWLVYDENTLSEIAFRLGYSSVAHLSAQFKKITGFTPSQFKTLKDHQRTPLDKVGTPK